MFTELFKKFLKVFWFLPGFLLWAAYPPMGEKIDVIFALAPLLWLARQGNPGESAKRCFQSGIFFWVATLSWMPAIVKNGGPWPLVVLGWGALAAYCAAYFSAFGYLSARYWRWAGKAPLWTLVGILFVEPVLWCGLELVRSRLFGGFAWNQLGVVAVNGGFGSPAALGGVYLCSAVVVLLNGTFAGIADRMIASVRKLPISRWRTLETLLVFALIWGIYQLTRQLEPVRIPDGRTLKVAMVQRNFPCVFQRTEENPYEAYASLLDNFSELKPELVVMSESALSDIGRVDGSSARGFADWVAKRTGAALLAGGGRRAEDRNYNSAALYADGLQCYDKVHLVPFGEFIPGDKLIPALQKLAPVGSCTPGELKLLDFHGIKLGVAICFEDTDSAQLRQLAAMGADVLVFITNDSWFSYSNESVQHAWQAVARAIETGLPVVRVGNSGVTGMVTAEGQVSWLQDAKGKPLVDCRGTMLDKLVLADNTVRSPYVIVGDWPLGLSFTLLLLLMILIEYKHYYEKRRYLSM